MTKLDALNQIIKIILEGEKEGKTILSAINEAVKHFGGKGDAITNGQAINQLYEVFTGEKENLVPENIRKGVNILGVEGEDWQLEIAPITGSNYPKPLSYFVKKVNTDLLASVPQKYLHEMFYKMKGMEIVDMAPFANIQEDNLAGLFYSCEGLKKIDNLNLLDTSKVTLMNHMFSGCSSLTSLDLSNFDTSQVTNMSYMFSACSSLTSLDLSNFDTSQVTNMSYMFRACSRLTSLTLGPNWASNNSITSFDLSYCPLTKESVLDVLNKLADRTATTSKPTLKLKSTVKALLSDEEIKIATDKGWTVA